jgi:hypothetical protein
VLVLTDGAMTMTISATTMCRIYPVTSVSANLYIALHQLHFLKRGCLLMYLGFNEMLE